MKRRLIIALTLVSACIAEMLGASVKLSVDAGRGRRQIEVGQLFYIYIDVTDSDAVPEKPQKAGGAKVLYFERTSQSSSFTSINGRTSQSSSSRYTITLKATSEGKYTFGPVSADGMKSNTVSYTIGASGSGVDPYGGSSSSSSSSSAIQDRQDDGKPKFIGKGDNNLFLRASVSQTSVFEQQALVYTVKLYTTYDAIKFIGATAAPKFDGFVVEESKDISKSLNYENFNGKTYASAVIARYVIFPQMTGQLKVAGNTYTVSVDQREYYHDPFWGSMSYATPLQLNVTPNDLIVNVKALPTPKPVDFCGGVGDFKITSQLKSREFKSNQAASIVYTVTGRGNLKYLQLPDLNALYPSELEVYTPKTDIKADVSGSNVSGSVTFDYSFMPLEEGSFKIPSVKLVYFNPETGKYETSVAKGYDIQVGKGVASSKSMVNRPKKFESKLIKVNPEDLCKERIPYIKGFLYWLWYIVPLGGMLLSMLLYRNYIRSHADMAAFNSRRADKLARRRLKKAYACMKGDNVEGFYDELLTALWGYMGDKLKMPTSELMRDNIRQVLESKGVGSDVIDSFVELLDKCEFAKYSPEGGKTGMQGVYEAAIREINEVENAFKSPSKKDVRS